MAKFFRVSIMFSDDAYDGVINAEAISHFHTDPNKGQYTTIHFTGGKAVHTAETLETIEDKIRTAK